MIASLKQQPGLKAGRGVISSNFQPLSREAREFIGEMNRMGSARLPFLFIIDFGFTRPLLFPLAALDGDKVCFLMNGLEDKSLQDIPSSFRFEKHPPEYRRYLEAFAYVNECQRRGDSYLCNLTFPTLLDTDLTLEEIYRCSRARYKLFLRDRFTVFSPETFVRIQSGRISSFPMKGTIDAAVPDAAAVILADEKETAEHITIVDLIRNDLGMVARNIRVKRFRYVERIRTQYRDLLQVSSEVCGDLPSDYHEHLGTIMAAMLPAGSVTGAPKRRTVEIIRAAEGYERGYYTGVFGVFDGQDLESAVMIRFVEQKDGRLYYKSGGGITVYSDPLSEYREMVDKVYVPIG